MSSPASTLVLDMLSQPCRALALFSALALPAAARPRVQTVLIGRGGTRTPDFMRLAPLGQVPLYYEGAPEGAAAAPFVVPQSTSILRYLADAHKVDEHWLPRADLRARAQVDSMLDFYHCELRPHAKAWVYTVAIGPRTAGAAAGRNEALIASSVAGLRPALAHLAAHVAARRGLGDARAMTLADLLFACELSQFALLPPAGTARATRADGAEAFAEIVAEHAGLRPWLRDVEAACGDDWRAAHAVLDKLSAAWRARPLA